MSICSRSCRSIHVYLLPELPRYLCLSTPGASPLSMSIYIRSFLSIHAYLLPELPLYLCLSTSGASSLSMPIYSRSFPSIYVYLHPKLPLYPCLSNPGAFSLSCPSTPRAFSLSLCLSTYGYTSPSMLIYSQSFLSLHVYLIPEISLYLCLSTPGAPSFSIYIFSPSLLSIHVTLLRTKYYYVTFPSSCVQHSPLDVTERICLGVADSWVTSPLPTVFTGVLCSIISPGRGKYFISSSIIEVF